VYGVGRKRVFLAKYAKTFIIWRALSQPEFFINKSFLVLFLKKRTASPLPGLFVAFYAPTYSVLSIP